ncbi:MAG TPA: TetR/AcrR family transcriptional regulator [Xanthobacteraceae bacterium]|nr:TetR/AcrR family transcriptional regulator [Xanthobacteraceae bacterium]
MNIAVDTPAVTGVRAAKSSADKSRPDPRRRILDAAAACFTRNGFHATSMQEVCGEAAMSPGALYRYFPSKAAIIIAIVEEERAARAALMAKLDQAPSFFEALAEMGRSLFSGEVPMICAELAPEVFAEASRNPALKRVFDEVEAEMDQSMRRALEAAQARGEVDSGLDLDGVLLFLNALGDGLLMRHRLNPETRLAERMPEISALLARMLGPKARAVEARS